MPTETPAGMLDGLEGLAIDTFFEGSFKRPLVRDPENLTFLGLADSYGVGDDKSKEFHRIVLGNGELPLSTLEQLVDAYIAKF